MSTSDIDELLKADETASGGKTQSEQTTEQKSEEETEFSKLSGPAQDRIRSLLKRAKSAETELEKARALAYQGIQKLPPAPSMDPNPDVQTAVKKLDEVGIATKDYVKQILEQQRQQETFENSLRSLEERESGQDGRPKFDRYEYQDFIQQNPRYRGYDPADVFGIMYRDELLDWEMKHRGSTTTTTPSLKSSRSSTEVDVWTPEYINQKIADEGIAWYEKNFDKIQRVMDASQGK